MYAFDADPIYLYQSDYVHGPAAINAKVAEKAVSDSKLELGLATFGRETRMECSKHLVSTDINITDYFVWNWVDIIFHFLKFFWDFLILGKLSHALWEPILCDNPYFMGPPGVMG